jgi:hypothetical protein
MCCVATCLPAQDFGVHCPLFAATDAGHAEVVRALLHAGFDANKPANVSARAAAIHTAQQQWLVHVHVHVHVHGRLI